MPVVLTVYEWSEDQSGARGTKLLTLTVGVVLGPFWVPYTNSRSGPRTSLGALH